jgi:hypothetical protein
MQPPAGGQVPSLRALYTAIIVLAFLVGLLGGFILGREFQPAGAGQRSAMPTAADIPLPPDLVRLASTWKCPCGQCKDRLLDCVCSQSRGALEIKRFMLDLQKEGTLPEAIRQKVTERYGPGVTAQGAIPQ